MTAAAMKNEAFAWDFPQELELENMLATLEQIFLPHKSEGIGIGTGTTLFGSFALNLSLLSPMRKLGVSIELEPSH